MDNSGIFYIGEFPPPFGGVTIKNQLVLQSIFMGQKVKLFDLYDFKRKKYKIPILGVQLLMGMRKYPHVVIGVGSTTRLEKILFLIKKAAGKSKLKDTSVFMMGGTFQIYVGGREKLQRDIIALNAIWVESEKIIRDFAIMGVENALFFPNCREIEPTIKVNSVQPGDKLKSVFFSKICAEKGVDIIIEAVQTLAAQNAAAYAIDFYGHIDGQIQGRFNDFVNEYPNVRYCGVFDAVSNNVYKKLNEYDLLLFPTKWRAEGVPGILVEAKIAGIAVVASDQNYNSEIVLDQVEGIILRDNSGRCLAEAIAQLAADPEKLNAIKKGSFESRGRYDIQLYREKIVSRVIR